MQNGGREKLFLDPGETRSNPFFHPVHFFGVGGADKPIWIYRAPEDGPFLEIPFLRFGQQGRHFVDASKNRRGSKSRFAQLRPAIDILLSEVGIFKKTAEPGVLQIIELRPKPVLWQPALLAVDVAEGQV